MLSRRTLLKGAAAAGAWLASRPALEAQLGRAAADSGEALIRFVDPFIGTAGAGRTFPGATVPAGLVQLSPDSRGSGPVSPSGYSHADTDIVGFSHTHLSGAAAAGLGDISVMPVLAGRDMPGPARSPFSHDREKASPGFYAVDLLADEIKVELTATRRVGIHRYRFPRWIPARPPAVLFDLGSAADSERTLVAQITIEGPTTVSGYRYATGGAKERRVYFAARFSRTVTTWLMGEPGSYSQERRTVQGPAVRALFRPLLRPGDPLVVKVALSPVSIEGALKNMDAEAPGWDFESFRRDAEDAWERKLQRIRIETRDSARKTVFYTGLYHAMISPALFCDADRAYPGPGGEAQSAAFQNHTDFPLADTHRALHPLMTLVQPERVDYFVSSLMAAHRERGQLPVWPLWGGDAGTPGPYHAAPVIVDAIMKNLTTIDRGEALEALKHASTREAGGLRWLHGPETRGYIPADREAESVSRTLAYGYDDWCISRLAGKLERAADRRLYEARAGAYRHLFDPSAGFIRARLGDGSWKAPFPPGDGIDYGGADAWQETWSVAHDVRGLMDLMGGPGRFIERLDALFDTRRAAASGGPPPDHAGTIGRYRHASSGFHHVAYLYAYAGAPWLAAARSREIAMASYSTGPDGLCGRDAGGQLSAWFLFTALGFYPVNPADGTYVLGAPLVDKATIDLGGGRSLVIEAEALSDAYRYVKGVTLNGTPLDRCWISHDEIAAGGTLRLTMDAEPNRGWASGPGAAPPSMTPPPEKQTGTG